MRLSFGMKPFFAASGSAAIRLAASPISWMEVPWLRMSRLCSVTSGFEK